MFPTSGQLKYKAKVTMGKSMPIWLKTTVLLVGLQVAFQLLQRQLGIMLGWGLYLGSLQDFPSAVTGFFPKEGGFEAFFVMGELGLVTAVAIVYDQALRYLLSSLVILLILAPLKIGALEQFWKVFRGEKPPMKNLLHWYTNPKLLGKAILVELILSVGCRIVAILAMIPSSALYVFLYSGTLAATGPESVLSSVLALLALALMIGGALAAFYLYTILVPISYCLAAQPEYGIAKVLRRGLDSIKEYKRKFLGFRLSFLPWYLLSNFTLGTMELYILPYLSFASLQFLQAAAIDRQDKKAAQPHTQEGWSSQTE